MKKLAGIIAVIFMLSMLSVSAFAHDMITYAEWGTPAIDAVKENVWSNAQFIYVEDPSMGDLGEETAIGTVWSLWDGDYIYFFASIHDKTIDAELKDDAWNQDAVGFMIDYAYYREEGESYRDLEEDSYAGYVNVAPVEGTVNFPEEPTIFGIEKFKNAVQSCVKLTSTGYDIEIRLPLKDFKEYVAGDKLGYEICINNGVGNGVREGQTVWKQADDANGSNSWQCSYDMGTLILNPMPEIQEPEPIETEPTISAQIDTPPTGDQTLPIVVATLVSATLAWTLFKKKNQIS